MYNDAVPPEPEQPPLRLAADELEQLLSLALQTPAGRMALAFALGQQPALKAAILACGGNYHVTVTPHSSATVVPGPAPAPASVSMGGAT